MAVAASALAATTNDYVPLVQIPGVDTSNFLNYLRDIYNFLISIVGILAMAALVYGGFRYLTSVGNPAAVEDAKDIINSAVIGLVLALSSWLILNEINPDILVLKKPGQIGAPQGKYGYNPTSFVKCFSNVDDPGYGTPANPCLCLDGTPQYATKTKANITLNVAPSSVSIGGNVTASGKLIDATGAGISGKSISITVSNAAVNGSGSTSNCSWTNWMLGSCVTITTGSGGTFSIPLGPSKCVATEQWQVVFQGDTTYLPAGSDIVSVATNPPGTDCKQGNYTVPSVASFMSANLCQNLCSDTTRSVAADKEYHCLLPKLGVGKRAEDATSGNQSIELPAAKEKQPIYFDAITNTKHVLPLGKIKIDLQPSIGDWLFGSAYEYTCILDPACGTVGDGCDPTAITNAGKWDPPTDGKLTYQYLKAFTYPVALKISLKNPSTGKCDIEKEDKNAIIKVEP